MTDRERWTVYPLLVLALALGLRDKLMPPTMVNLNKIVCDELDARTVVRTPAVETNVVQAAGMQIIDDKSKPRVQIGTSKSGAGTIETFGPDEHLLALITGNETASTGMVTTFAGKTTPLVSVGAAVAEHGEQKTPVGTITTSSGGGYPLTAIGAAESGDEEHPLAGAITTFSAPDQPLVVLTSQDGVGALSTVGKNRSKLVDLTVDDQGHGGLRVFGAANQPLVVLDSAQGGGRVMTLSEAGRQQAVLTHDERGNGQGVFFDAQGRIFVVAVIGPLPQGGAQPPAAGEPGPEGEPQPEGEPGQAGEPGQKENGKEPAPPDGETPSSTGEAPPTSETPAAEAKPAESATPAADATPR